MSHKYDVLESGFIADIRRSRWLYEKLLEYYWEYYCELAYQKKQIYEALKGSLAERSTVFTFQKWQRGVKYKYSIDPLNTTGSLVDPGGRFNIGRIDPTRFTAFPGLYLACDKGTALAELLGRGDDIQGLTPEELALTRPASVTVVSVSGDLESVLDVTKTENLSGFVRLIRDFRLSPGLIKKANKLGVPRPFLVKTAQQMVANLHYPLWREWPIHFDVPHPSQILGQIAADAGIEGLKYSSILTQETCLVIYPQNFVNSSAFVELDDPPPSETVPKRIDSTTFMNFIPSAGPAM
jgi:RES domain-containing protein